MSADLTRRRLFAGIGVLIAAPSIVRVASIMPVRPGLDDVLSLGVNDLLSGPSFQEMVWATLQASRPLLIQNVMRHNALLAHLQPAGIMEHVNG